MADATALTGLADGTGTTTGVRGFVSSPSGRAGLFQNFGGGDLIVAANSGDLDTPEFEVDNDGDVTAKSFSGAGSGLTGVTAGDLNCSTCVSRGELAGDSVTSQKIENGSIAFADIGGNGCGANQLMKWNGSAWACATAASDLNCTTCVSGGELAGDSVTGDKIQNGSITLADIGQNGCTVGQGVWWNGLSWACFDPGLSGYQRGSSAFVCAADTHCTYTATCPSPKKVISGGIGGAGTSLVVRDSYPKTDSVWEVVVYADGSSAGFSIYVICAYTAS